MNPSDNTIQNTNPHEPVMPSRKSNDGNKPNKGTLHKPVPDPDRNAPKSPGSKPEKLAPGAMTLKMQQAKQNVMSLPQQEVFAGEWAQRVGAAKIAWAKLTNDELLQSCGELQKLSGLLQKRYGISSVHAARKVNQFFDNA